MLKHTHNRKLENGDLIKVSQKKVIHSIDLEMVLITINVMLMLDPDSDEKELEWGSTKDIAEKITASKVEKAILNNLIESGRSYYYNYEYLPKNPKILEFVNEITKRLFPQLV